MPLFLSQPTCKSSENPMGLTISRIQPPLPTSTVTALLLSVLNTAVRMTQFMSLSVQNPLVPSCLIQSMSIYCHCLSTPNPSFYTRFYVAGAGPLKTTVLCHLAPCWAWPVGDARGRRRLWSRRRELLLPVLFSVGSLSACSPCEWHPSPPLHLGSGTFLPVATIKSTLQLFPTQKPCHYASSGTPDPAAIAPSQWSGIQSHGTHPLHRF